MTKLPDVVWVDDDGVVHVRNSERGTLDRCPQQWWWSWRDGLRPKEVAKPLWFGTAIHEALAHYYAPGRKRRKDFIDKFRESADMEAEYMRINIGGMDEDQFVEARVLGETMLTEYVKRYAGDRAWDVIATEQSFEIAVRYVWTPHNRWLFKAMQRAGINTEFFYLNGTFDGVYRDMDDRKRTKLMEHKTAASISIGHLPMDNQAGTYWMVAQSVGRDQGWLKPKENITQITYNFLRKALPDPRPKDDMGYATNKPIKMHYIDALAKRGVQPPKNATLAVLEGLADEQNLTVLGDRSAKQPPPLFERHEVRKTTAQRKMQLSRLQSEVLRMNALVLGLQDVTKAPSRDHCGFCSFREMCELHESGAGWTEFRDALYRSTDPYADHRKSAS